MVQARPGINTVRDVEIADDTTGNRLEGVLENFHLPVESSDWARHANGTIVTSGRSSGHFVGVWATGLADG